MIEVLDLSVDVAIADACVGAVAARGCLNGPAPPALDDALAAAVAAAATRTDLDARKQSARALLRFGKYVPTGRGKPASEYLHKAALERRFPRVGAVVDVGNLASLVHLLPVSTLDVDKAAATAFVVRRGRAGEAYVFNAGGQTIDLQDLVLTAALPADAPTGSAVKDALATKLDASSSNVLCVVYGRAADAAPVRACVDDLARLLRACAGARDVAVAVEHGAATT